MYNVLNQILSRSFLASLLMYKLFTLSLGTEYRFCNYSKVQNTRDKNTDRQNIMMLVLLQYCLSVVDPTHLWSILRYIHMVRNHHDGYPYINLSLKRFFLEISRHLNLFGKIDWSMNSRSQRAGDLKGFLKHSLSFSTL